MEKNLDKKKIVGVRFISGVKIYHFDASGFDLKRGDYVVVENQQGEELARVIYENVHPEKVTIDKDNKDEENKVGLAKVIRLASADDKKLTISFHQGKHEYISAATGLANKLHVKVRFIDVTRSLDKTTRLLFMFVADGRVDFRELLTLMSKKFNSSIRLYQVGPRDAARIVGGVGVCGQQLCCRRFLNKFASITMEMAREQDLVNVGSNKISGVCGKLLCCLDYELEIYKKLKKGFPRVGENAKVKGEVGRIIERNVLLRTVSLVMENGLRQNFSVDEVEIIKDKSE
ncbi:MAG: regulatory iron-sulfur-containing complex subunit RicT [Patescibacteria group bacterium]